MIPRLHALARALLCAALPADLRDAVLDDLDDEMRERIGAGSTPRQAMRWSARQSLGSLPSALRLRLQRRAAIHDRTPGGHAMHGILQDIRYAGRMMRTHPLVTCAAVGTLALGIGATTAIFSVVHAALLRDLPFPEPDRLVRIHESFGVSRFTRGVVNPSNFDHWERHGTSFSGLAAMRSMSPTLTGAGDAGRVALRAVTPSFFDVLGVSPAVGRRLTEADGEAETPAVLLSHAFWVTRFGADPDITSRTLTLDGSARPIAGVMPEGFAFPYDADLWQILPLTPAERAAGSAWFLGVVGRLKPGVSVADAQAEMEVLARQLQAAYPARQKNRGAHVVALHEDLVFRVADGLGLLQGAVALVLLIAVANVANLLLARGTARRREFAIRAAVGASRARIVRQLLTESLLLGSAGALGGVMLAAWLVRALVALSPLRLPAGMEPSVDVPVLMFALAAGLVTSLVFGLAPALVASRAQAAAVRDRSETAAGAGRGTGRLRSGLVVAEVALAVMLLAGAGLLIRSFALLAAQDVGFGRENVLTAVVSLPSWRYDTPAKRAQFWQGVFQRLQEAPGLLAAGGSTALPFSNYEWGTAFQIVGREDVPNDGAGIRTVHPGYFATLGIPILRGRNLDDRDQAGGERAVLVNEAFARAHLGGLEPIGQRLRFTRDPDAPAAVIVGVAGNTRHYRLSEPPAPEVYRALAQEPAQMLILGVKTAHDPLGAAAVLRSAVQEIDGDVPVEQVSTMEALIARTVAEKRFYLTLMALFSAVALGLACIGIYSVMAYVVTRRTREIGLRMALGAAPGRILRGVLGSGGALVLAGLTIGMAGALLATRVLESMLFGVTARDPVAMAAAVVLLALLGFLAAYAPARRAARLDPAAALRQE